MGVQKCFNCGNSRHPRRLCPAKDSTCDSCGKIGHWKCVCRSTASKNYDRKGRQNNQNNQNNQSAAIWPLLTLLATLQCFHNKTTNGFCKINIKDQEVTALIDSGSTTCSFISKRLVGKLNLSVYPSNGEVSRANSALSSKISGHCFIDFTSRNQELIMISKYAF